MKPHEPQVALYAFMPYGAPELLESQRAHMSRALFAGTLLVTASMLVVCLVGSRLHTSAAPDRFTTTVNLTDVLFEPPPTMTHFEIPSVPIAPPVAVPSGGDVLPVRDDLANPAATVKSQPALVEEHPGTTAGEPGPRVAITPIPEETMPAPDDVPFVDELPSVAQRVLPVYPELARDAGVEGTVLVQALVGKDGRVKDVRVQPGHSIPLLDDAALDAVKRWVFTPALQNGHPVPVWVRVPVIFRLH